MAKKKLIILGLCTIMLTSCGTQKQSLSVDSTPTESMETEEESLAGSDAEDAERSATETEYTKRDGLEWQQLLDYDTTRQQELSALNTDLSGEEEQIRQLGQAVLDALAAGEVDQAVDIITSDEWMAVMLPKLVIGQRNYYLESDTVPTRITLIADEYGAKLTAAECANTEGQAVYLEVSDDSIRTFTCGYEDGGYAGTFCTEQYGIADGGYTRIEGTVAQNGCLQGNLQVMKEDLDVSQGLVPAWKTRSADGVIYHGEFDSEGKPAVETPKDVSDQGRIAYAVREDKKAEVYLTVEQTQDSSAVFDAVQMGVATIWK